MTEEITIRGARLHNLKNISLTIPKNRLEVLTGISGSGKSTLGFDILLKEGQRQYLESLGIIAYGMAKAPVDDIQGLAPTVSVDPHLTNRSPRSTVGTLTDVYTYLRVLFARLGHRPCPVCGRDVPSSSRMDWAVEPLVDDDAPGAESTFPCPHCGAPVVELDMAHFSFNKPAGACPACMGLGSTQQADLGRLVDEKKCLADGAVLGWNAVQIQYYSPILQAAAAHYGFEFDLTRPVRDYSPTQRDLLFHGVESALFRRHFPAVGPPLRVRDGHFEGVATSLLRRYRQHVHAHTHEEDYRDRLEAMLVMQPCPNCGGTRLRPESRAVSVGGQTITALSSLALNELGAWLGGLPPALSADELRMAEPILADLKVRIGRLSEVGAGYLALERAAPSLSAGEVQRLRLAALLGSQLSGLLYVFDEPTVGLHACDTRRLVGVLRRLRDLGNTVLVIEHDLEVIAAAEHVIDFGPGAGRHGGQVVVAGTPAQVAAQDGSLTGAYLSGRLRMSVERPRRIPDGGALTICGARHHNLQNITVRLPLGMLVAVTGVSGSGKSSLVFDTLERALRRRLYGSGDVPGEHDAIQGWERVERLITIDQEPIGRMPRSNAATYTDVFTPIRMTFAATPQARRNGLAARHFSFNMPGGRCERCQGAGVLAVKMHFMPEVEVRCPACHGRRFTGEVLAVQFRGRDISQVLDLTVEEALALFAEVPAARARLQVLCDVGLGYLQLGQPATTLSGGEAQRIKLAKELGRRGRGRTLYLFDEPTTGLHPADIERLLGVLQRLVEAGGSVIVVEHNLELIKTADWIIDLGPEGGAAGGRLIAEGSPEQVAQVSASHTGRYLREMMEKRESPALVKEKPFPERLGRAGHAGDGF